MTSTLVLVTSLTLVSFSLAFAQHQHGQDAKMQTFQQGTTGVYSCPMHPDVVSDHPGKCPKCGMELEKQSTEAGQSPSHMMGKPTFEQSFEGINIRIWLITQEEHKRMMNERMTGHDSKEVMNSMDHGMMHGVEGADQDHHMMDEGMKHDGKGMNRETMEAMMAGTHHVMVAVTDEAARREIADAKVAITVTTPSKKSSTVDLVGMMNHFGGGVTLEEIGGYRLDATVTLGKETHTNRFSYEVK